MSGLFLLVGCKKDESISNQVDFPSGKFIVDSSKVTASIVTIDSMNYQKIDYELRYHFERYPGTINYPKVIVKSDTFYQEIHPRNPFYPDSLNKVFVMRGGFGLTYNLSKTESIYATFVVSGLFWIRNIKDSSKISYGSINWKDSVKIIVK